MWRPNWNNNNLALGALLIATACAIPACSAEDAAPPPPAPTEVTEAPAWTCEDQDGDSFGYGCRLGPDCDDNSADLTTECLCADQKSPGCSCAAEGEQTACGTVYSKVGDKVVCGQGIMRCDGEEWGECLINNAVTLKSLTKPSLQTLALGGASACDTNPCDPGCRTFTDTPEDLTLPLDDGVVASAAGITLPLGQSIIVPGAGGSGFNCTDAAYPADAGCGHHICRIGTPLALWCDGDAPVQIPLTIFSDGFDAGNSNGWTLDTNWAIGNATSSTGHSSGNADPASDTTSTSDDNVAGTVLGGNIGGTPGTIFSDSFGNINNWDTSGNRDWTISSNTGSSSNCDSTCIITNDTALNLSAYGSASLSFDWNLNNNLDNGEGLRLEAFNGSTWTTLLTKVAPTHDDSNWHTDVVNLSSYLVSGFRLRFTATSNETNETIRVDNVVVTGVGVTTTRYLTSPSFNTAASVGNVTLSFRRWLNLNADFIGKLEVYNGSAWVALYTTSAAVSDNSWQSALSMSYDITAHKSANTRIRFSYSGASANRSSGWNIDDVLVVGTQMTPGSSLCVNKVCAVQPSCCTDSWSLDCVGLLDDACEVECAVDTDNGNACTACFNDPAITQDLDGDGQSPATGDCRECDPSINAGAYDLPGNNVDENCDGTPDNETIGCDTGLAAAGDANSHARAMGLCKVATANSWGLVSAAFVRANGTTLCNDPKQYRIMSTFGTGNAPTEGEKMAAFSSGTARATGEANFVSPDGVGYNANTSSTPKYAVPPAASCSSGQAGYDSCGLKLVIRAPRNANSFGYNFSFFTSEYPEWLCTKYNDAYVAYYEGSLNTQANKNISFDSANNPVSVNNGLFTVPGTWPPPTLGTHALLNGTGFDGVCDNDPGGTWASPSICGGSTGWLQTTAPVAPGEDITLIFNVWDTGDHQYDSTVLLDNFTWSTESANIQTGQYVPGSGDSTVPATYAEGWFYRDYDMSGVCDDGLAPFWSLWSWNATTPSDSKIEFYVQTADTAAGLATAPRDALVFSASPGPEELDEDPAVAEAGDPDTQTGAVVVHDALTLNGRPVNAEHVRISARLIPSADQIQAPVLTSWNLQTSCEAAQ